MNINVNINQLFSSIFPLMKVMGTIYYLKVNRKIYRNCLKFHPEPQKTESMC